VSLLPIVTQRTGKERKVSAVLAIPGHEVPANVSVLELLTTIAGLSLEVRQAEQKVAKGVVGHLLGVAADTEPKVPVSVVPDLAKLPRDEQETHARAQRFARVRVAEMRLYRAQAVKEGRENHNLFEALRKEIEQGREQFGNDFLTTPTMIDYFHVELVRTLANDDASLLGPDYPGPLV
jgi:long-subunit acyl-CoA synthetase (AMP-forming)